MSGGRFSLRLGLGFLAAAVLVYAATDPAIGWLIPMTVAGAGIIAGLLVATRPMRQAPLTPDRFGGDSTAFPDVMNIAHVRVAGLGGLGLVVVAFIVSLQYQLLTAVMIAGATGGTAGATAVILHRRPPRPRR